MHAAGWAPVPAIVCCQVQGQCPNCGAASSTYFGDILTVKGNREVNQLDCGNCKAKLEFSAPRREVRRLLSEMLAGSSLKRSIAKASPAMVWLAVDPLHG